MPTLVRGHAWGRRMLVPLVDAQCLPMLSLHMLVQYILANRKGWVSGFSGVLMPFGEMGLLDLKSLMSHSTKLLDAKSFVGFLLVNLSVVFAPVLCTSGRLLVMVSPRPLSHASLSLLIWKGEILNSPLFC